MVLAISQRGGRKALFRSVSPPATGTHLPRHGMAHPRYGDAGAAAAGSRQLPFHVLGPRCVYQRQGSRRHHQGRRPAFAFRHCGHQRNHAERHHPFPDRRAGNKGGGVLGKKLEAAVVDPALELAAARRKGPRTDQQGQGRRRVAWLLDPRSRANPQFPVFKELNSILFHPVQYEGGRERRSATCSTPVLRRTSRRSRAGRLSDEGRPGEALGAGGHPLSVYPPTTNKILEADPQSKGARYGRHRDQLHAIGRSSDWQMIAADIKKLGSSGKKTAVFPPSSATPTFLSTKNSATSTWAATDIPVVAFSVGEEELAGIDTGCSGISVQPGNHFAVDQDAREREVLPGRQTSTPRN